MVYFSCAFLGHDSERMAESNEMQDTGFMRNFVTVKSSRFSIVVQDEEDSAGARKRGRMRESVRVPHFS